MRLLFIGSIPGHRPGIGQKPSESHTSFIEASREIGRAVAGTDHRILLGSASANTADFHIFQGVIAFCAEYPTACVHVELHYPEGDRPDFGKIPDNLHILDFPYHADDSSPHKWIIAHARAVDAADVVIAIGGGVSTRLVGNLAEDRGKPVVAIACFGGSAESVYHTVKHRYRVNNDCASHIPFLTGAWRANESADHIIRLASALLTASNPQPHSYFISYNWKNCQDADHIETLLRRENRPVLRDEVNVAAGSRLSAAIEALIGECDTFVGIWSDAYAASSWCPQELESAINLQHRGGKPARIILLVADSTPPPIRVTDNLRCQATTRNERELAITKLIRQEQGPNKTINPSGGSGVFK